MKRFIYILGTMVLCAIIVLTLGWAVLTCDKIENTLIKLVNNELSTLLGTNVKIGSVEYQFPAKVTLFDLYIEDQQKDTLAYLHKTYAHFKPMALKEGVICFSHIEILNGVGKIYQIPGTTTWNYQFLVDSFRTNDEEETSPLRSLISIQDIQLKDIDLHVQDYLLGINDVRMDIHHFTADSIDAQISQWGMDIYRNPKDKMSSDSKCSIEDLQIRLILKDSTLYFPTLQLRMPRSDFNASGGQYNMHNNGFNLYLHNLDIVPADIALFVPQCKEVKKKISINGNIIGNNDSIRWENIIVKYDEKKIVDGSINIYDIHSNPYLKADMRDLHTNVARLQDFLSQLYAKPISFPKELLRFGDIHYRGIAEGYLTNLHLNGAFRTDLGSITTYASLYSDSTFKHLTYDARIEAKKMRIGELLNHDLLKTVTLQVQSEGTIDNGEARGDITAFVRELYYNDYTYQDININGAFEPQHYDGHLSIDDEHLKLNFDGIINLQEKNPELNFNLRCRHFDSKPLHKENNKDKQIKTRFNISAEIAGADVDNMVGYLVIDSLFCATKRDSLLMKQLKLYASAEDNNTKSLTILSDYLTTNINGSFRYRDILPACQNILHHYLPTAISPPNKTWKPVTLSMKAEGNRLREVQQLFNAPIAISEQPTIKIDLSSDQHKEPQVDVLVYTDTAQMGKTSVKDFTLTLHTIDTLKHSNNGSGLALSLSAETKQMRTIFSSLAFSDTILSQITVTQQAQMDEHLPEGWRDMTPRELQHILSRNLSFHEMRQSLLTAQRAGTYGGDVRLITHFDKFNNRPLISTHFQPGKLLLRDSIYTIAESNITYCAADTSIQVSNFRFAGGGQMIEVDGIVSTKKMDTLNVKLQKIDASYIVPFILPVQTIMFNGLLTGDAHVAGVFKKPTIEADIHIDSLGLNDCYFGDAEVDLHIYPEIDDNPPQLQFQAEVDRPERHVISLNGEAIFDGSGRWKLDMITDSVPLNFVNHWTSYVLHDLDGYATGKVVVGGHQGQTFVLVNAAAQNASFTLPWTGARYTIPNDTIVLDSTSIRFPNVHAQDIDGNMVVVNGTINHEQFHDFVLDLHVDAHNALVFDLNKKGEMLQGKVYANGHVDVTGHERDLLVAANAVTSGKSQFRLSVDNVSSAYKSNFIHFVQKDTVTDKPQQDKDNSVTNDSTLFQRAERCLLTLNIEVNPQLLFQLVLGERNGDMIQAHGNGALRLTYDTQSGDVHLLGTYAIEQGTLSYTVANVIRKEFTIGEGSTIIFSGDPTNPQLDVTAKYRVTASLKDLFGEEIDQLATTRTSIPVLTCLHMRNTLNDPLLNFSLEFPASDQTIQQQIRQIINTDEMLMRQVIYLLVFGRFFTPDYMSQSQYATLNSTYSLLSSTVTSQINAWLSKLTDMLTLGVAIRTDGEGTSASQEYEAQFQLQPVDRLIINGNVGYRYNDISNQPFFGDLDVEVMLTEDGQFRLKGYTHTVDKYSLREASTIQGVGFVWKKDFNWPNQKQKKQKKQKKQQEKEKNQNKQ